MVRVRLIELPLSIRGFTREDVDGNYLVFINDNLSDERKRKTLIHELKHINKEDFLKEEFATEIEEST